MNAIDTLRAKIAASNGFSSWSELQASKRAALLAQRAEVEAQIEAERVARESMRIIRKTEVIICREGSLQWFSTSREITSGRCRQAAGNADFSAITIYRRRTDGQVVRESY